MFTKVTSWLSFRPSRAGERNGESEKKELLLEVPYGWAVIQWDIAEGRLAYQMRWWILPERGQSIIVESGYVPIRSRAE